MKSHATLEELSGYLDTALVEERQQAVGKHIRDCESCRERLAGLQRVVSALDRLRDQMPPRHLERVVARRIEHLRGHQSLGRRLEEHARRLNRQSTILPFFGVVLALGVIVYLLSMAIAREEQRPTRMIIGRSPSAVAAPLTGERREIAERVFHWTGSAWAEAGTEDAAPARRLRRTPLSPEVDPELRELLGELGVLEGAVRFRFGGEVLELQAARRSGTP